MTSNVGVGSGKIAYSGPVLTQKMCQASCDNFNNCYTNVWDGTSCMLFDGTGVVSANNNTTTFGKGYVRYDVGNINAYSPGIVGTYNTTPISFDNTIYPNGSLLNQSSISPFPMSSIITPTSTTCQNMCNLVSNCNVCAWDNISNVCTMYNNYAKPTSFSQPSTKLYEKTISSPNYNSFTGNTSNATVITNFSNVMNANACMTACEITPLCGTVTYDGGNCILRKPDGIFLPMTGTNTYIRNVPYNSYVTVPNISHTSTTICISNVATPLACQLLCDNTNGCKIAQWTGSIASNNSTCTLKNGYGLPTSNNGVTSYVRIGSNFPSSYTPISNTDVILPGSLGTANTNNPTQCQIMCDMTPGCVAATLNGSTCTFKGSTTGTSIITTAAATGSTTFLKKGSTGIYTAAQNNFGGPTSKISTPDAGTCMAWCDALSNCTVAVWDPSTNFCYPRVSSNVDNAHYDPNFPNVPSYVKATLPGNAGLNLYDTMPNTSFQNFVPFAPYAFQTDQATCTNLKGTYTNGMCYNNYNQILFPTINVDICKAACDANVDCHAINYNGNLCSLYRGYFTGTNLVNNGGTGGNVYIRSNSRQTTRGSTNDYTGGTLSAVTVPTIQNGATVLNGSGQVMYNYAMCKNICDQRLDCNIAIWGSGDPTALNQQCWLKNVSGGYPVYATWRSIASKNNFDISYTPLNSSNMSYFDNRGTDATSSTVASIDECMWKCRNNASCVTAVYSPLAKTCWMKSSVPAGGTSPFPFSYNTDRITIRPNGSSGKIGCTVNGKSFIGSDPSIAPIQRLLWEMLLYRG
eukprot:Pompholyxophrys_sp_v1_NODE_4_length_15125_cov_6.573656.p2 type:complete len:803 gc:universal NODE_4_length_15125_cov_6.573656:6519-8927(+)